MKRLHLQKDTQGSHAFAAVRPALRPLSFSLEKAGTCKARAAFQWFTCPLKVFSVAAVSLMLTVICILNSKCLFFPLSSSPLTFPLWPLHNSTLCLRLDTSQSVIPKRKKTFIRYKIASLSFHCPPPPPFAWMGPQNPGRSPHRVTPRSGSSRLGQIPSSELPFTRWPIVSKPCCGNVQRPLECGFF